jgi:hypothetical protein
MIRKLVLAAMAAASFAMLVPDAASARGGFGGGGFRGGGGFHGGGFRGGGFGGGYRGGFGGYRGGFYRGAGIGALGLGLGLGYYGAGYGYGYGYPVYSSYYDGGCYVVRRRVWTPYGWRFRPVQVCG